jgi:hypothetical protein
LSEVPGETNGLTTSRTKEQQPEPDRSVELAIYAAFHALHGEEAAVPLDKTLPLKEAPEPLWEFFWEVLGQKEGAVNQVIGLAAKLGVSIQVEGADTGAAITRVKEARAKKEKEEQEALEAAEKKATEAVAVIGGVAVQPALPTAEFQPVTEAVHGNGNSSANGHVATNGNGHVPIQYVGTGWAVPAAGELADSHK